jgi:hypothetical protein
MGNGLVPFKPSDRIAIIFDAAVDARCKGSAQRSIPQQQAWG